MAEVNNRKFIIELLNQDLQGEHGAIIQYLYHAWTLDVPGISTELERIARDEMYHYQWLAHRIVELGGEPAIGRNPVYLEAPSAKELILMNSKAEEEAIAKYEEHIAELDDERTIRLLHRIVSDENQHIGEFVGLAEQVEEIEKEPSEPLSPEAEAKRNKLIEMLNDGVKHEYSVVLQYLHQSFTAKDRKFGHSMEQSAIVEMKHMGWLAEHVAEMGGEPSVERNQIVLADDVIDMIKANISDEEKATDLYEEQIASLEDEELKELINIIKYHEEFHLDVLKDFLQDITEKQETRVQPENKNVKPLNSFTVGSLIDKK